MSRLVDYGRGEEVISDEQYNIDKDQGLFDDFGPALRTPEEIKNDGLKANVEMNDQIAKDREAAMTDLPFPANKIRGAQLALSKWIAPESYKETMQGYNGITPTNVLEGGPKIAAASTLGLGAGLTAGLTGFLPRFVGNITTGLASQGASDLTKFAGTGNVELDPTEYATAAGTMAVPEIVGGVGKQIGKVAGTKLRDVLKATGQFEQKAVGGGGAGGFGQGGTSISNTVEQAFGAKPFGAKPKVIKYLEDNITNTAKNDDIIIDNLQTAELNATSQFEKKQIRAEIKAAIAEKNKNIALNKDLLNRAKDDDYFALGIAKDIQVENLTNPTRLGNLKTLPQLRETLTPETYEGISQVPKQLMDESAVLKSLTKQSKHSINMKDIVQSSITGLPPFKPNFFDPSTLYKLEQLGYGLNKYSRHTQPITVPLTDYTTSK